MKKLFVAVLVFTTLISCKKIETQTDNAIFEGTPVATPVPAGIIDEASGIADSKINPGYLWVENDGNNPDNIYLLNYNGDIKKSIALKNAPNRDWEDMTLATGPLSHVNYIYLADIGDNFLRNTSYFIYRFPEPSLSTDTVYNPEKITFQYPDGSHDAEAILVDNNTKDIFIITKSDVKSRIYKLPYQQTTTPSQNGSSIITATFVSELPFSIVTSAAMSPDGTEIVIKTYSEIYYWTRNGDASIEATLATPYKTLAYKMELQGEAICFKNDNTGFFTLSEKPASAAAVSLNFYKRK